MKQQVRHEAERNRLHRLKNPYVNSLFLRLMLLTAVITLVTVLLASLLPFSYLKTELRTDIENYNNQRLLHVKNTVDSTALSPVAAAFSDIVLSNQVSQASGFSGVGEDIKSSGLYSIYGLLGRKNVQYSLTDIALYNPRSKVLLSATYGITYLSGTTVKLTSDVSWVEEIGLIPSGTRSAIWLAPRAFPDGSWQAGENHLLSLIAPLNSGERNGLYACVSISDAVLMNAVESAGRSPDTKYFLLSLNGDLIAGQPEETILEELQNQSDELRKATGNSPLSLSLNGMMITAVRSDYAPWLYVMCLPESTYYQKSNLFQRNVLLACMAVLIGMLLVCAMSVMKISYPFGKLVESIRSAGFEQRSRAKDVFGNLEEAFTGLLEETDVQAQLIHGNRELVSRSFFSRLLQEKPIPAADMEAYQQFLKPYYPGTLFSVCCIRSKEGTSLQDAGKFLHEQRPEGAELTCLECDDGGVIACVCNTNDSENLVRWFEEIFKRPQLEKCCGAIGDSSEKMEDVSHSYRQALSALQYAAYFPKKFFFRYGETENWDRNISFDRRQMDNFLEQLAALQSEEAVASLEGLQRLICETPLSWQSCTQILEEILLALEKVAENNHIDLSELFTIPLPDQLGQHIYLNEMFQTLENETKTILQHIQKDSVTASAQYAERAIDFIAEHYQHDISIQDIADELGISRYHLCRVFKESQGMTLLEYIAEIRMRHAKQLLEETDLSVSEVARQVGFNNVTYFHKRFKQSFGITPNQIRKN